MPRRRYSTETNRGHDSYTISTFDMHDTYLPQYQRAFENAQPPPYGVSLLFVCLMILTISVSTH